MEVDVSHDSVKQTPAPSMSRRKWSRALSWRFALCLRLLTVEAATGRVASWLVHFPLLSVVGRGSSARSRGTPRVLIPRAPLFAGSSAGRWRGECLCYAGLYITQGASVLSPAPPRLCFLIAWAHVQYKNKLKSSRVKEFVSVYRKIIGISRQTCKSPV